MSLANAYEQYFLEKVNAERAEAGVQPLAFDSDLNTSSELHSRWMLSTDSFSHTGSGGTSATTRMVNAGYSLSGSWATAENIAWVSTMTPAGYQDETDRLHANLMNSSGHRANILNGTYREVGIGLEIGDFDGWDAAMVTQNFARTGGNPFLTGVAFDDNDSDRAYDVGEGLSGATVTVRNGAGSIVATTNTAPGGGYEVELASGSYSVTFSASGFAARTSSVSIGASNVKLDWIDPATTGTTTTDTPTSTSPALTGTNSGETISGTVAGDLIRALAGNDNLYGKAGDDRLEGGDGSDLLRGGLGQDELLGGAGGDRFDWDTAAEAGTGSFRDIVLDFVRGSDRIDLAGIDARSGTTTNDAFRFVGSAAFGGVAGELRAQLFDTSGTDYTLVQGDVNGDRVADLEVQINGLVPLSATDFVL